MIGEGGIQANRDGARFWDESQGYSEAARAVLAQPASEDFLILNHLHHFCGFEKQVR